MKKKTKIIAAGILTAAVAAAGFALFSPASAKELAPPAAYQELKKSDMVKAIDTSGKISSIESKNVTASVDRIVKSVSVKSGDKVRAGQVLAQLDVSGVREELNQAQKTAGNELAEAQRDMEEKKKEYETAKFTYEIGDNSQQNMLKAQRAYENAAAVVESKRAGVGSGSASLQKQISDGTLKSPVSGTVTAVNAEEGAMSSGVLFTIENLNQLQVTATVSEYDVNSVKPGMNAIVKTEMTGDQEFTGTVLSVAPAAQKTAGDKNASGKVLFQVNVGISDENQLIRIGGNAQVRIIAEKRQSIFTVPFDALVKSAEGNSVYTAERKGDGYVVKALKVTTGMENDVEAQIEGEGLKEGMKLLRNAAELAPGMEINLDDGTADGAAGGAGAPGNAGDEASGNPGGEAAQADSIRE